jgi:DHA2 family methylenomycin A resistance protein-like MFS transporter
LATVIPVPIASSAISLRDIGCVASVDTAPKLRWARARDHRFPHTGNPARRQAAKITVLGGAVREDRGVSDALLTRDPARAPAARSRRAARLGLAAICAGFLIITIDATIVNVALGPIVADLGGSLAGAQWIVSAYTIAFATFLLSAGAWSDRIGSRRAFLIGLGLFGLGSAACAAAPSMGTLIAARAVQGLGAALLMPCSLALITHNFPAGQERRSALAAWAGISGVGMAVGPILGGFLTDSIGWRAIFLVNLPVAALAAVGILGYVAETGRHRLPLDPPGQVLVVIALGAISGGFILAGDIGWTAVATLALLVAGIAAAVGFWRVEGTVALPMLPPELFHNRRFSLLVGIAGMFNFCLYGSLFCFTLYVHEVLGLSPLDTGLALVPMALLLVACAFSSSRFIARVGEWRSMVTGLSLGGLAAVLLATVGGHSTAAAILTSLPFGGVALCMPAMTALAMAEAPPERIGLASGVQNASRQAGGALGVALLGTLLGAGTGLSLHLPLTVVAAFYAAAIGLTLGGRRLA